MGICEIFIEKQNYTMKNILITNKEPLPEEPYLLCQERDGYSGDNTKAFGIDEDFVNGVGWYCYKSDYPERIGKYKILPATRTIHLSHASSGLYVVNEAINLTTNTRFFVYMGKWWYSFWQPCIVDYSGTTDENSIGTPLEDEWVGGYLVHGNMVKPTNSIPEPIPGVAYNRTETKVFYNPKFPFLNLSSTPETEEKANDETMHYNAGIVNFYTYEEFGITTGIIEEYRTALLEGKTSTEDFNIYVDGRPVYVVNDIRDCSCWGGFWFEFDNGYYVVFDGSDAFYVTDDL